MSGSDSFGNMFFVCLGTVAAVVIGAGFEIGLYVALGLAVALYYLLFYSNRLDARDLRDARPKRRHRDHH